MKDLQMQNQARMCLKRRFKELNLDYTESPIDL